MRGSLTRMRWARRGGLCPQSCGGDPQLGRAATGSMFMPRKRVEDFEGWRRRVDDAQQHERLRLVQSRGRSTKRRSTRGRDATMNTLAMLWKKSRQDLPLLSQSVRPRATARMVLMMRAGVTASGPGSAARRMVPFHRKSTPGSLQRTGTGRPPSSADARVPGSATAENDTGIGASN